MQFLNGLDNSFNQVKSHILLMEPLPNVKTAFSLVSREESNQKHISHSNSNTKTQPSAFVSKFNNQRNNKVRGPIPQCKNCGLKGHSIEKCFKIIGYPKDYKPKSDSNNFNNQNKHYSANLSTNQTESSMSNDHSSPSVCHLLTEDQYSKFLRLIGDKQGVDEGTASANMAGISYHSHVSHNPSFQSKWVVDSGANQHMVAAESRLVDAVDVSNLDLKVRHPNGTTAHISKIGNVHLSKSLTLFDVFDVPDFNVNLLSVYKLCKDSRCQVTFNENECLIQDLQSKGMVENGNQSGGHYYLNGLPTGNIEANVCVPNCFISKFTWHNRLGHPAEPALNVLKQRLNITKDPLPPYDVCHKAKQTRDAFPISQTKSTKLGDLTHLDVWVPIE